MKKKEYNIKDKVWIHLGEPKLVEGRIVEVIDLEHLKEGHSPDRELYIIELKTGIDDIYEVRDFDQISPDASGPINLFRKLNINQVRENSRYLKKVGMKMPVEMPNALTEIVKEINQDQFQEENEPTAEQIHAAIERAEKAQMHSPLNSGGSHKPKKRQFVKRKKNDSSNA